MRPQVYIPPRIELFREVVGDPTHEFANLRRELHRVERENAKLRELVQDMDVCISHGAGWDCGKCPRNDAHECDFDIRMDKLGIEVGE